ncbi:MAG: class I SAM-dependent methyltransferase [Myxococcota bacterium]
MIDWSVGSYELTAKTLEPIGKLAVELAAVVEGETALDLACGTGNVALELARRGAHVTAVDPAERLLEVARSRAKLNKLAVKTVNGTAEQIPARDGTFDVAISVFGMIFSPDAEKAARELVRVVRPGGRFVITSWIATGVIFEIGAIMWQGASEVTGGGGQRPSGPWSSADSITDMFARNGATVEITTDSITFEAKSAEAWFDEQEHHHPVWMSVKKVVSSRPDVWANVRQRSISLLERESEAKDRLVLRSHYLLTRGSR